MNTFTMPLEYESGLLSFIVVTYNQQDCLMQTIDSILEQDYGTIELIVADDASSAFDEQYVSNYIEQHNRGNIKKVIIQHNTSNLGTVRNINSALLKANGQYIKIIAGDDTLPANDICSLQINALESNETSFAIVGKLQQCDAYLNPIYDHRVQRSNEAISKVLSMNYNQSRKYIFKNDIFPIAVQATTFRRNFFVQEGLCDEKYKLTEDVSIVLKLLKNHTHVLFLNEYCVNHRSEVGISASSRELFSPKRIQYYQDCVTYAEQEIGTHPDVYGTIASCEVPKINRLVLEMSLSKREGKTCRSRLSILVRNLDAILYYTLNHPTKLAKRIVNRYKPQN